MSVCQSINDSTRSNEQTYFWDKLAFIHDEKQLNFWPVCAVMFESQHKILRFAVWSLVSGLIQDSICCAVVALFLTMSTYAIIFRCLVLTSI